MSSRDSLHEAEMWAVEGLTHRYPTKVLAELIPTCPQYCGHCTRMDLVGNDTLQVLKYKFEVKQNDRWDQMLDYLRRTPQVRDVVVSGGDMANVPIKRLEDFVSKLLDIENIRDIRIASKGLMGLPQHFLQDDVLKGLERLSKKARERGIDIAVHTHVNHAQSLTPLVAKAAQALLDMGYRDVRNQGVLMRGVNSSSEALLDLCFTLLDHARKNSPGFSPRRECNRFRLIQRSDAKLNLVFALLAFQYQTVPRIQKEIGRPPER
jgi:lysine 2,3-aminomutase